MWSWIVGNSILESVILKFTKLVVDGRMLSTIVLVHFDFEYSFVTYWN
jgi:hypothetical protein